MKNKKVIFIDDNEQDLFMYGQMMKDLGYEVLLINDLEFSIDMIFKFNPNIIFLDFFLSNGKNGIDLLKEIRKAGYFGKICMLSGEDNNKIIEKSIRAGADDYHVKPIYSSTINNVIERSPDFVKKSAIEKIATNLYNIII